MSVYYHCRLKHISLPQEVYKRYLLPSRFPFIDVGWQRYQKKMEGEAFCLDVSPYSGEELQKDFPLFFSGRANHLEICCGNGDFLLQVAQKNPTENFLGVDIAYPCLQRAMKKATELHLDNIFFYHGSGQSFLQRDYTFLPLDLIMINFPDPWPKKRHYKRRVVQSSLLQVAEAVLQSGAKMITATDIFDLFSDHLQKIEERKYWEAVEKQPWTEPPLDYYQFSSMYQKKNLANSKNIYYTYHQRR